MSNQDLCSVNDRAVNGLAGIGVFSVSAAIVTGVKIVTAIGNVAKKIIGGLRSIFGGKYSDRPLIRTRDSITDLFKKYGYSMLDANGKSIMEKFGLKQAQIDDKNDSIDYYAQKFAKLYEYVITVLSDNGRPDLVYPFIENTPLYVPGGTKSLPYLENLLATNPPARLANPPGSLTPLIPDGLIKAPTTVANESGQTFNLPGSELVTQAQSSYQVLKDAQGQIIQIRDAAGNILQPGTLAYNNAANEINNPQQAGMGGTVVTVLLVSAILGTLIYLAKGDKPKTSA